MEPSNEVILANLKMHIELFEPCDIDAGIWAYYEVAKSLGERVLKLPVIND